MKKLLAVIIIFCASQAGAQVCSNDVTLRQEKGSTLSWTEVDDNFINVREMCVQADNDLWGGHYPDFASVPACDATTVSHVVTASILNIADGIEDFWVLYCNYDGVSAYEWQWNNTRMISQITYSDAYGLATFSKMDVGGTFDVWATGSAASPDIGWRNQGTGFYRYSDGGTDDAMGFTVESTTVMKLEHDGVDASVEVIPPLTVPSISGSSTCLDENQDGNCELETDGAKVIIDSDDNGSTPFTMKEGQIGGIFIGNGVDVLEFGSNFGTSFLSITHGPTQNGPPFRISTPTAAYNWLINQTSQMVWEGATNDAWDTTLTVAEPTQDNTVTIPDRSGTMVLTDSSEVLQLTPTDSPSTCGATEKGAFYSDDSLNLPCYCNGTNWVQMDDFSTTC